MIDTREGRRLIGRAVVLGLLGMLAAPLLAQRARPGAGTSRPLRIAFVQDDSVASRTVLRGVRFGTEEGVRTAVLMRAPVPELVVVHAEAPLADVAVAIASDSGACARLLRLTRASGALVVLAGCPVSAENRRCAPHVFRISAPAPEGLLWHPTLEAYGAAQLNDRFVRWAGEPMTAESWAGWMSVKIATEAAMRAASTTGSALAAYLAARTTRFDGHKGVALAFDDAHVLSGPVYDARGKTMPSLPSSAAQPC